MNEYAPTSKRHISINIEAINTRQRVEGRQKNGPNRESNAGPRPVKGTFNSWIEKPEGRIIPLNHRGIDDDILILFYYDVWCNPGGSVSGGEQSITVMSDYTSSLYLYEPGELLQAQSSRALSV
jgi:hypothetical protein